MSETVSVSSASVLRRLAAVIYDTLLLSAVLFFATAVLLPLTSGQAVAPENPWYFLYLVSVSFLYFGWFWTHGGQTLGLKAWKLKCCLANGQEMTWAAAALRFVCACLSLGVFFMGFLWAFIDAEKRMWHDRLSSTKLVRFHP